SKSGFWQIDDGDNLTGGQYDISLEYSGFSSVNNLCQLTALKRVGSGNWSESGTHVENTGTNVRPVIKRTSASGWSNWGIGSGYDNPLPIELLSFTAVPNQSVVDLEWI